MQTLISKCPDCLKKRKRIEIQRIAVPERVAYLDHMLVFYEHYNLCLQCLLGPICLKTKGDNLFALAARKTVLVGLYLLYQWIHFG